LRKKNSGRKKLGEKKIVLFIIIKKIEMDAKDKEYGMLG